MSDFSGGIGRLLANSKSSIQSDTINIEFDKLVPFRDINGVVNPSEVDETDPEYIALKKNISERGLDHPITVRPLPGEKGMYQILSGHHRVAACKSLGYHNIQAFVKSDMNDDDAAVFVALDNFNRKKNYKPSEKARFYKLALDAKKRKSAGRKIEGVEAEGRSIEELADLIGESKRSIQNYIRLTSLIPELLKMVDDKDIKMVPAVELSYIPLKQQTIILTVMTEDPDINITAALAKELRLKSEKSELTEGKVRTTLGAAPKGKKNPFTRKVKMLIPEHIKDDPDEITDYLIKAITFYQESQENKEAE